MTTSELPTYVQLTLTKGEFCMLVDLSSMGAASLDVAQLLALGGVSRAIDAMAESAAVTAQACRNARHPESPYQWPDTWSTLREKLIKLAVATVGPEHVSFYGSQHGTAANPEKP